MIPRFERLSPGQAVQHAVHVVQTNDGANVRSLASNVATRKQPFVGPMHDEHLLVSSKPPRTRCIDEVLLYRGWNTVHCAPEGESTSLTKRTSKKNTN